MGIDAFNRCVDEHSDALFRFILKNIRDEEKARDIVQDSFEKVWQKIDTILPGKMKSYLFSTAYHTMIDAIRKEKSRVNFENIREEMYSDNGQYTDLNEVLHEAVTKLPAVQRSVIMLRDYEGYSYEEIAGITGLSESQVKVYIYRGRVFLKKYIGRMEVLI
ncbi:MAG: RNA polymerase sigma factor [Marinilabiliales bacterium]|nr:MAG: RNA polymerase sigma factor [Marinilabiliales bacterium]